MLLWKPHPLNAGKVRCSFSCDLSAANLLKSSLFTSGLCSCIESRHAHADLVFIQNGMLQPWLDENGLSDNTQVSHSTVAPFDGLLRSCMHHTVTAGILARLILSGESHAACRY